jgi:hypothetical protein
VEYEAILCLFAPLDKIILYFICTDLVTVHHRPQNVAKLLNGGRIAVNAPHGAPLGVATPTNHCAWCISLTLWPGLVVV